LNGFLPVLGIASLHGRGRGVGVEGEPLGGQGRQLIGSEPRSGGESIQNRTVRSGQPASLGACVGGLDESGGFRGLKRSANTAAVGLFVQLG
jgi:hypothetical protein